MPTFEHFINEDAARIFCQAPYPGGWTTLRMERMTSSNTLVSVVNVTHDFNVTMDESKLNYTIVQLARFNESLIVSLTFYPASCSDTGYYICQVSNNTHYLAGVGEFKGKGESSSIRNS